MRLFSWLRNCKQADPAERRQPHTAARRRATCRPRLELLEDRTLPSSYTAATTSALIADINAANKAGGTNTITLAANTTFDLTAVNNTSRTNGAIGLPVIGGKKADNLTIIGNGDTIERSTAAGTPAFRLFDVAKGNTLTLQNVTLQNGLAQGSGLGAGGGAILNEGTLTVSGSTLSGNTAIGDGGAIANDGTLTVSNSTLSNNTSPNGGGINSDGTAAISGSTLSGNTAPEGWGGGIFTSGTMTVSGSTLSNNTAQHDGGGIYAVGSYYGLGTLTISGSILSGNTATEGYGGGIYEGDSTVTVSGSTLTGNSAIQGGGIYNLLGALTISGSTIGSSTDPTLANVASFAGGGIYNASRGTVTVKNSSTITGNTAPAGSGADIYNYGVVYLDSSSSSAILDGNPAVPI